MTRREKALRVVADFRKHGEQYDSRFAALADEYDDLLAFFDAWENDDGHWDAYKTYCDNQKDNP